MSIKPTICDICGEPEPCPCDDFEKKADCSCEYCNCMHISDNGICDDCLHGVHEGW